MNSSSERSANDRTPQEWLQLLADQQQYLKMRLRNGCAPSEYKTLADLEQAVELVIRRLHDNDSISHHHRGGDIHKRGSDYAI